MGKKYKDQTSITSRKATVQEKAVCRMLIKKTEAKLRRIPLTPETLIYTDIFNNACALSGIGQYKLAAGICKVLGGHIGTVQG